MKPFVFVRLLTLAIFVAGALVRPLSAQQAESAAALEAEFDQIQRTIEQSTNEFLGVLKLRDATRGNPVQKLQALLWNSMEHVRVNQLDDATRCVEQALQIANELAKSRPEAEKVLLGVHRVRGLVYLRVAEVRNCIERHNSECCIFPLQGGGLHSVPEPARAAKESYLAYLERDPADLKIRWLLNVVCMALGEHPDGVPEKFRIRVDALRGDLEFPRFPDIAGQHKLNRMNNAGGCIAEDFDGDHWIDLVISDYHPGAGLAYFQNDRRGGFENHTDSSQLGLQRGGLNIISGDYNNDGRMDILVLRGAWLFDAGKMRKSLLRNNGDGTFSDVTRAAGLADPAYPTQAATWLDYDNDGDLDLYVGHESRRPDGDPAGDFPSLLYRNNGDGTFTDVARAAGVTNDRYCKGVTAGDFDNDGWSDLYVSNLTENRLYRNRGDGTFEDVASKLGVTEPRGRAFAPWFWDFDNDGWLDLWAPAFDAKVEDVAADFLGVPAKASPPRLYRNRGDGSFVDVAKSMGVARALLPMGANFGDLNNDGWLDFYLGTGDPDFQTLMPNVMFLSDSAKRFVDVTTPGGFGHLQKGHGIAFADFDEDGDQDIFHQIGGFYPSDQFRNGYFQNPGFGNRWVTILLEGVRSNRIAYGARIRVLLDTPGGPREIHRVVGSVSSFGGSPRRQEIGLANATAIREIEVWWPASNTRQKVRGVPLDSFVKITEGRDGFERVRGQVARR